MIGAPIPSADETRANQTFDALLWALSRPGQIKSVNEPAEPAIVASLLDRECRVFCADPMLMPAVLATGAIIADLPEADHIFAGPSVCAEDMAQWAVGSDFYPDDGATVVVRATFDSGVALKLSGPGIDGDCTVQIAGLPAEFWALRANLVRYPMGFDLFFVDGARVLGVPRSTQVEVL